MKVTQTELLIPASCKLCGAVQSTVKAARAKASVTVQPFNLLHLDIQSANTVTGGLQQLVKPEDIHGEKCHPCTGTMQSVIKQQVYAGRVNHLPGPWHGTTL